MFEDFARVSMSNVFVAGISNPERERNRIVKHLIAFHRPIRALFLKYSVRGCSDHKDLKFRISEENFKLLCVDIGLVQATGMSRSTSGLTDTEHGTHIPLLGGAFRPTRADGSNRYPKAQPLTLTILYIFSNRTLYF